MYFAFLDPHGIINILPKMLWRVFCPDFYSDIKADIFDIYIFDTSDGISSHIFGGLPWQTSSTSTYRILT